MVGSGILMVGGDSLCCDSLERGESSFIGSGVVEQTRGSWNEKSGIEVEIEPSPHSRSTEKKVLETCSLSLPHPYVLATLAHYEGCNISILLGSWFKDVVPHGYVSLGM
jgi:hypothetical protein